MTERVDELAEEALGKHRIVDPVMVGNLACRHVERPEQNVPCREQRREIGVAALRWRSVMPAMEYRRRYDVSQWPERPVEIGMDEEGGHGVERNHEQNDGRRYTDAVSSPKCNSAA